MRTYDVILPENIPLISKEKLAEKYNDAIQEIWFLTERISQLHEENEALWKANEELMDQLYG